jgi:uncharacterized Tic20 family protein
MADAASGTAFPPGGTTQDERTMAVLAHVLQLVGGWIGPLIIFFLKRQSRFVSFHSLQVLFLQLLFIVINMCVMMVVFSTVILTILRTHGTSHSDIPTALFAVIPLFWLSLMGIFVLKILIAVIYSVKAGRGEWAEYPVLGGWARRVLKIGPNGEPVA